jgi:hypothetical protein
MIDQKRKQNASKRCFESGLPVYVGEKAGASYREDMK